ncbi:MAG: FMN-binding protein, partial [Firmicutes bacterium]|nr:FMN-binding protein [Bacillota bacterium]
IKARFKGEGKIVEGYSGDKLVGYVITAKGEGYSSIIKMLVGLTTDYKIKGVTILSQQETPGLGDRASKPDFLNQFPGKGVEQLKVLKGIPQGDDHITAITGATITSRAVTEGVEKSIQALISEKK